MPQISMPTLPTPPILGWRANLYHLAVDALGFMSQARAQYGDIVRVSPSGSPNIFINAPADAAVSGSILTFGAENNHHILSDTETFHTGPILGNLVPQGETTPRQAVLKRLGTGLFGVNGEAHRRERRLLQPAFHRRRIQAYRDDMVGLTEQMLGRWRVDQPLDFHQEMMKLTLQVAGRTLFGLDFTQDAAELGSGMQTWLKLLANPLTLLFPYDWPLTPYRRFVDLSIWLDEQIRAVIARKRQQGSEDSGDVLSMLLHAADDAGDRLSEDELIGHANVLFVAGHETSSNALTWTLFLLAQHPEVMAAVYEELTDTLHGDAPTIAQLEELSLLDRVIKESMRILPPVPASGRLVVQDTELGGYPIERGHEVLFSHYHTHHDPHIYDAPERFDPDRWLTITPTAHEYMPFSAGRRMCIGSAFAQMEIKVVLAMVLQRYRLQLQPQLKVDPLAGITMGPQNGLPLIVRPQDQRFAENRTAVRGKILACVAL